MLAAENKVLTRRYFEIFNTNAKTWFIYAAVTTLFWGVWGAFIEIPEKAGFPATLGYSVWALTMIPCAVAALWLAQWKLERDLCSIFLGLAAGLLGSGGQLVLFLALRMGPAYLVFPIISLYPVLTVVLSVLWLKEKASRPAWAGIWIAIIAVGLLSYQSPGTPVAGHLWLLLAILVFLAWGIQAYVMKFSNQTMQAESIFFYAMVSAVSLIPLALWMTDFSQPIQWGFKGPYFAALIQVLNSIGLLSLVYAIRYGKAIVVVPMTALPPVITVILSLILYWVIPHSIVVTGLVLAGIAIYLMVREEVVTEAR